MKQKTLIRHIFGASIVGLLMQTSQVVAAPLNLDFAEGAADISVTNIFLSYNSTSGILNATGTAFQYDPDTTDTSDAIGIIDGTFSLNAAIDGSGNLSSGNFVIVGDIDNGTESLLTGDFTNFGFVTDDTEILEFVFNVTGGSVSSEFGGTGGTGGLIIGSSGLPSSSTPFVSDWNNEFETLPGSGIGFGTADAKAPVVPEPAEYSLILGSILLLTLFFVRKSNSN